MAPHMSSVSLLPPRSVPEPPPDPFLRSRPRAGTVLLLLAVVLGAVARLRTGSALWLDEALSVEIARRPVPDLLDALRRDGSPPLYYLLLHGWTAVTGTSDTAVRALSTVLSLAALPVTWAAGRRLGGDRVAAAALVLLAVNPFAVRYATEARMYALVQLLAVLGLLAVLRALERPSPTRLLAVLLCSGGLVLTHYWSLFLVATAGLALLLLARRRHPAARRTGAALAAGLLLLVPWLPSFLFQLRHTGVPWAQPPHLVDVWYSLTAWSGGGTGPAVVLALLTTGLLVVAVSGHRQADGVVLRGRVDAPAGLLLGVGAGSVVLGIAAGAAGAGGWSPRYTSGALPLCLLAAALGVRALPRRGRTAALAVALVAGLASSLPQLTDTLRTQAPAVAAGLRAGLEPGDLVVYCPDQLGPSVSRLLPEGVDQVVYPTGAAPGVVDWVDYARRNAAASPSAFARSVSAAAPGAVWVVTYGGYRTLEGQCEAMTRRLEDLRGRGRDVVTADPDAAERAFLVRYAAP